MSPLLRAGFLALLLAAAACPSEAAGTYGYFRTVEGYSSLTQADSKARVEIVPNYPLLVEDRVQVSGGARLETVLPDGSLLRLAGETEIFFERLALSGDREDEQTLLQLIQGEMQLVVSSASSTIEELRIDTVNATVYVSREGAYRVATDGRAWSEVVVREGWLEVVTERGSIIVRAGEQALIDGERRPRVTLAAAAPLDSLERWGEELTRQAAAAGSQYVDPQLSYSAASLQGAGEWISVGTTYAWRPYTAAGWRPYTRGWWTYTPSGITWVSTEPWGWLTHHYGSWSYWPAYGWVWYPGYTYYPATVYWYWGPSYVAWIPWGYYHYYYRPYSWHFSFGFHYGIYGWAGGYPGYWADWTFCPVPYFGHHGGQKHYASGAALATRGTLQEVPQGVITTDTRGLSRETWNNSNAAIDRLKARATRAQWNERAGGELVDVTDFVARREKLSESVKRAVSPRESEQPIRLPASGSGNLSAAKQRPDAGPFFHSGSPDRSRTPGSTWDRSSTVPERSEMRSWRSPESGSRATTPEPSERPTSTWNRSERWRPPSVPSRPEASRSFERPTRSLSSTPSRSPTAERSWREPSVRSPRSGLEPPTRMTSPSGPSRGTEPPVVRRVIDGVRSNRSPGSLQRPSTPPSRSPDLRPPTSRTPSSVSPPRSAPSRPEGQARSSSPPSRSPRSSGRSSSGGSGGSSRSPTSRKPPDSN